MPRNAILDDLHAVRRQLMAQYQGDAGAYLRDAQKRLEASGRPIDLRKQRIIRGPEAGKQEVGASGKKASPAG